VENPKDVYLAEDIKKKLWIFLMQIIKGKW